MCCFCLQDPATVSPGKIYTRKELVMIESSIADFQKNIYIQEIQQLAFHLPHIQILGTNHCDHTRGE